MQWEMGVVLSLLQTMSEDSQAKLEGLGKYIESSNADAPAYCLLKVEEKGWVFVSYIPDTAKVKEKMVYASSREKVKKVWIQVRTQVGRGEGVGVDVFKTIGL